MNFATKQKYNGLRKLAELHFAKSKTANPLKSLLHVKMARQYLSQAAELLDK